MDLPWQTVRRRHEFVPSKILKTKFGSIASPIDSSPSALSDISDKLQSSIVEAVPDVLPTHIEPDEYPFDIEAKFTISMKGETMFEEYYCITANYPLNKIKPGKGGGGANPACASVYLFG